MLPIFFQLGPISFFSFGLMLSFGFLIFAFLVYRAVRKEYLDEEKVFDVIFLSTIGAILGARIFYIIEHFDSFGFSLLSWILVNAKPGFSLWGGVGVFLTTFLLTVKSQKLPLYKMFDLITIPLIVLFIFAEVGAFLAGNEIGLPTKLPWGVIFFSTLKRHPISLYKAITAIILLVIMVRLTLIYQKKRIPVGSLFFTYILLQSFFLFIIEFLKEDVILIGKFFKLDHFIYFMLFLTSSFFLYQRLGRSFKNDLVLIQRWIGNKIKIKKGVIYDKK